MKKILISFFALMIFASSGLHGRIKEARHERNFLLRMEETPFAVVLFYDSNQADKQQKLMIRHLKRDLQYVVEFGLYQNARVALYAVDVAKDALCDVASRFKITNYPTIALFKGGIPVRNIREQMPVLRGYATRQAIREFIDKHMREDVSDYMQEQYERSERAQMDRTHLYFSYGMTLPASVEYAYPYYYSPYYYYGYAAPGIGVQLGF